MALPREVVLELTVRRASKPIYSPLSSVKVDRADLSLHAARAVFEEMSAADDAQLFSAASAIRFCIRISRRWSNRAWAGSGRSRFFYFVLCC